MSNSNGSASSPSNGHAPQPEASPEEAYVLEQISAEKSPEVDYVPEPLSDEPDEVLTEEVSKAAGKAYVDTVRGVFITSEGEDLKLRVVRTLIVERIVNGTSGKPKVPQTEVLIAGKHKRLEDNPADENYQAALAEWKQKKNETLMTYLFTAGISGTPTDAFVAEYSLMFPDANDLEMKYLWVVSLVPDDDLTALMEAIMGQTALTQKGLEEAAANFQ